MATIKDLKKGHDMKRYLTSKPMIFLAGMMMGVVMTFIIDRIPWREIIPDTGKKQMAREEGIGPMASFVLPLNDRINARIEYYLRPPVMAELIASYKRAGQYLPMIREIFEEYNLPQALTYLPILESGFLPESTSRAGAAGIWQLMPSTASDYGLKYNRWIDERRDPEKSNIVAAEFLRFLYDQLGHWDLALAAYNLGYSELKRAMRREGTTDYWQLKRIPKETFDFVPSFYALLHILSNPKKYNVRLPQLAEPLHYETIELEASFALEEIARLANLSPQIIKRYNPALISNIAPSGQYSIRVPVGVKEQFLEQAKATPPDRIEITYLTYRVRRHDTLYKIAQRFGTTVHALMADNNLRSARHIKPGQLLRVAVVTVAEGSGESPPPAEVSATSATSSDLHQIKFIHTVERDSFSVNILARYYAVSKDEILSWKPWLKSEWLQRDQQVVIYKPFEKIISYRAKRGDSLWRLARQFHSTVPNIKMWNQLPSSNIYPGQRLIVKLL